MIKTNTVYQIEKFYEGMKKYWHPVCSFKKLKYKKIIPIQLLGEQIVILFLQWETAALLDVCKHYQAQLSLGKIDKFKGNDCIRCPYHGWAYDRFGKCIDIPQINKKISKNIKVPSYQTCEKYGIVWVCLDHNSKSEIPDLPEYDDGNYRKINFFEKETTKTNVLRMIMGTLDNTHFPWVHGGILGSKGKINQSKNNCNFENNYLKVIYSIEQPNNLVTFDQSDELIEKSKSVNIKYTNYVTINTIRLVKSGPSGNYSIWLSSCPNTFNESTNFWIFSRNYDKSPKKDKDYLDLAKTVRLQDKVVIESQTPKLLIPFNSKIGIPIMSSDKPIIEYQKWIEKLGII